MFHNKQQGFSIVTAIFLIVVLSLLSTGMIKMLSTSQQSISQEITSMKSYFAARSGLQIAMYQAASTTPPANNTVHNLSFINGGLANTTARITYIRKEVEGEPYYQINSRADFANTNSPEYARRELTLRFQPNN